MGEQTSEVYQFIIIGTLLLLAVGIFIVSFLFFYRRRHHRFIKEKSQMQMEFNQELLRTQLEIQEQTLKNISQEIHDNIGQGLTLAKLNLSLMNANEPLGLAGKIEDSKKLVAKAINDLRDIAKGLNSDNIVAIGLVKAVEYELKMIEKTGSYKTSLEVIGEIKKLTPQKELILFRIVQEVLNNIIKHANGKNIVIIADYSDGHLQLHITDDGDGFDSLSINKEDAGSYGLGIRNMNSRAKLIGAEFFINSAKGNGTEVKLTIPIQNFNLSDNGNQS